MRRETSVTINSEGRDKGKSFMIREMPAYDAEQWAMRVMMLLMRSGTEIPPHIFDQGIMGIVVLGAAAVMSGLGKAPWGEVKPLLDEMLGCLIGYNGKLISSLPLIMNEIEEATSYTQLREEILSLHVNFSIRERIWNWIEQLRQQTSEIGSSTGTSLSSSAP